MIPQLGPDPAAPFPDINDALEEPDGLLAWGGGLEPERLVNAYRLGIFPWYSGEQPILWWCPWERSVIRPADVHVSRSLRREIRKPGYEVTADRAFESVIEQCALPRKHEDGTWITKAMRRAYIRLHELGVAHSIEVWDGPLLVGGLYGVAMGGIFFGESMFSRSASASKIALAALCRQLHAWGFELIDCQLRSQHLDSMGAVSMERPEFMACLARNTALRATPCEGQWGDVFEFLREAPVDRPG